MLSAAQRAEFDDLGFVRIAGAFGADDAARMRAVVWRELERKYGIVERDSSTWTVPTPTGLTDSKRHPAFAVIGGAPTVDAFDGLLGRERWQMPRQWGQVMVTFPSPSMPWVLPHTLWHVDFHYVADPAGPLFGLKVFAFFGDVGPRGGGTLVVARSHRLVGRFISSQPLDVRADFRRTRLAFMHSHPWLQALAAPGDEPDRTARLMHDDSDVDGIAARVVELTGRVGDVIVTHPWTLHHVAPNTGERPRFMRGQSIHRVERALLQTGFVARTE